MYKTNQFVLRVMLMASLSIFSVMSLRSQNFIDVFGVNEFFAHLQYNSLSDDLSGYFFKTPYGIAPQYDDSSSIHFAEFNSSLQILGTNQLVLPETTPYHYYSLSWIDNWPNKVIAYRYDLNRIGSLGGWFPFAGNCDLCDISPDSLYNCHQLLPDSAYGGEVTGSYLDGDSLIMMAKYAMGSKATATKNYRLSADTTNFQISSVLAKYSQGFVDYYPVTTPLKLPNGNWLVQVVRDSAQSSYTYNYAVIDNSWSNLVNVIWAGSEFTKSWLVDDKVLFITTEILTQNWQPNDPIKAHLALIEYDYTSNSVTNRYYFNLSSDSGEVLHHHVGYDAIFNGEYFVIALALSEDLVSSPSTALVLAAIDTTYNLVSQKLIEDTLLNATPLILGNINTITQGRSNKEFFFGGSMDDSDVNPGSTNSDLMLGYFNINNIGVETLVRVNKQQIWLYPNPSNGNFTIINKTEPLVRQTYKIINSAGEEVLHGVIDTPKVSINTDLSAGTYYLIGEEGDFMPFIVQ